MSDTTTKMQRELYVTSFFILYLILFSTLSCSVKKGNFYKKAEFEIIRKKSKDETTQIIISCYDKVDKSDIPAGILINRVFFNTFPYNKIRTELFPGVFDIEVFYKGKQSIKLNNLLVKSGDSIIIKSFMKEDLTPIY